MPALKIDKTAMRAVWADSGSVKEVADKLGLPHKVVRDAAHRHRQMGIHLKSMVRSADHAGREAMWQSATSIEEFCRVSGMTLHAAYRWSSRHRTTRNPNLKKFPTGRKPVGSRQVALYLDLDMQVELKKFARANRKTYSAVVAAALRAYLDAVKITEE